MLEYQMYNWHMREIRKKTFQPYFDEVLHGNKTFDVRVADFDCQTGDIFILEEVDNMTKQPTGREIRKKVGYVLRTKDVTLYDPDDISKYGYQVISLLDDECK